MEIKIIYWSGTGNTQKMAEAIAEGIEGAGATAKVMEVSEATPADVEAGDRIAFGCPAMGAEELEEAEMRPFMDEVNPLLKGKKVLLFGSYSWATGEWMETWTDEVFGFGAELVGDGLIAFDDPDDEALEACREAGKELAS